MPMLADTLTYIHPDRFDHDPLHCIGVEIRAILADTLTEPLTGDMLVMLHRLERVELERHEVRANRRKDPAPPLPAAILASSLQLEGLLPA